ncbi:MAG: hypothetical protein J6D30_04600 [Clostridia bacterium]|nr:hypothetical protein [Clostridia bacterium]MBP3422559.1 hypothetical protein [Clostridia bacterium]
MKKKEKKPYVDDGHTIYDMDGIARTGWWSSSRKDSEKKKQTPVGLTHKERWAVIRAAMSTYLPVLLVILAGFGLAMALISFWIQS